MKPASRINRATFFTSLVAAALLTSSARCDVIMDWNAKADAIGIEKQLPNAPNARGLAMLHIAMFEAVNAIDRRYAPYKLNLAAERTTSKEAAAASAAYDILVALYPDQKADLDATLAASLSGIAETEAKSKGIELGKKAAAGIIALRANDSSDKTENYRPYTMPGVYVPTATPIESTSPALTPWVMGTGSQFRPGPPPALSSETWTRDLNEIREIGSRNSSKRTAEQTNIGRFWFQTGPRTYNPIVKQIAMARKMDVVDCARLFALSSIAGVDAFIAVFDAKYTYNLWRPVTAIRNADLTSNAATPREESWMPLGVTPMHPEYPCAHCIISGAVAAAVEAALGTAEIPEVSMTSPTAPGVTHRWTNIRAYNEEVSHARIWAGFHYRFSVRAGQDMGRKVGRYVVDTIMQPATR